MKHDVTEIAVQRLLVTLEGVDQRLVPRLEFFEVERKVQRVRPAGAGVPAVRQADTADVEDDRTLPGIGRHNQG